MIRKIVLMVVLVTVVSCTVLMVNRPKGDVEVNKEFYGRSDRKLDLDIGKNKKLDTDTLKVVNDTL